MIKKCLQLLCLLTGFITCSCSSKTLDQVDLSQYAPHIQLYPFLSAEGLYGYVDKDMHMVIQPQFTSASLFTSTGFAVVSEAPRPLYMHKNHYGVINVKGELVIPYAYDRIDLLEMHGSTFIWTDRQYLNRWRFWDWQGILFGDNILSGNAKLIDTEVWRSRIRLGVLETHTEINKTRSYDGAFAKEIIPLTLLDSVAFLQGDHLYDLSGGKPKLIAKDIYGRTRSGALLQGKRGAYRLMDNQGHVLSSARYRKKKTLRIDMQEEHLAFPVERIRKIRKKIGLAETAFVFEDEKKRQYIFPNLDDPFPMQADATTPDGVALDTVLNRSRLFPDETGQGNFYFNWGYIREEKRVFQLNAKGQWKRFAAKEGIEQWMQDQADTDWQSVASGIAGDPLSKGWELYSREKFSAHLYLITLRREVDQISQQHMGVWDKQSQSWIWPPVNYMIQALDRQKGYWTYRKDRTGKYGIYFLPGHQYISPPKYDKVDADGWVEIVESSNNPKRFLVDWTSGQEFRELR